MTTRLTVLFVLTLALAAPARADIDVADGRIGLDGYLRASTHWWQTDVSGLVSSQFSLEPTQSELGMTVRLNDYASMRSSVWMNSQWGIGFNDLFLRLAWPSGWGVTVGQFVVPLSGEVMIRPQDFPLVFGTSMQSGEIKPAGTRDVGVAGTYRRGIWDAAVAVVNGHGAGSWSDNNIDQKALCGRLLLQPWCSGPWFGARIYRGFERNGDAWLTIGGEATYQLRGVKLAAEVQNHLSGGGVSHYNSGYVQALYPFAQFESGLKFDVKQPYGKRLEMIASTGLSWRPVAGRLQLAGSYSYHNNTEDRWLRGAVSLMLQAEL